MGETLGGRRQDRGAGRIRDLQEVEFLLAKLVCEKYFRDKPWRFPEVLTRRLWIPAINNDGRFGRWAFLEIKDPWSAQTEIRALLTAIRESRAA